MLHGRCHALRLVLAIAVGLSALKVVCAEDPPTGEALEFFEKKIRPVLVDNCYECHSGEADEIKGDLRVDSRDALRRGGASGPAVVPGSVDASLLIQAVRYTEDAYQMPPAGKLSDQVIQDLEKWIEMGAPDPRTEEPAAHNSLSKKEQIAKSHWAFQPPRIAPLPVVQQPEWIRSEIDVYLLARLEQQGIAPSAEAERRVLIRRLYFDLLGLPPSFEDVESFVADPAPDAYERLVDRLLSRPQFGERWARHWLDVARYSDTKGYVFQEERNYAEAYTYRDWLIQALNADLPYDQFVKYQIAADQLPPLAGLHVNTQAATGFLTLGRRFLNNKHDIIDDRIDVLTRGVLGLTVTCARCHDHKYDPIPTADYYSLYGVFASTDEPKDQPLRLMDSAAPGDAAILVRGNSRNPGDTVPRQFLEVLAGPQRKPFQQGSGRLELADAIVARDNPLTARVLVNRVWLYLFGDALVRTPSDFGTRSDPPAQPEVLDLLAVRFMQDDWSLKKLIRRIVLSSAYQQSSAIRAEAVLKDSENRLVWRQSRRRLDLEAMRDALLAVSQQLDCTLYGPSVDITKPPFAPRRTVYAFIDRQNLPNVFRTFDFASPDTHAPQRLETMTPQQALYLMNHPFVLEQAEHICEKIHKAADVAEGVGELYRGVLARQPTDDEITLATQYIQEAQHETGVAWSWRRRAEPLGPWEKLVQVLLMSNEFQFVD